MRRDLKPSTRVARYLLRHDNMLVSPEQASEALGMKWHTLRKYLYDEGTSYKEIKNKVRQRRFRQMTTSRPPRSAKCYCYDLGFTTASGFTSWFAVTYGVPFLMFKQGLVRLAHQPVPAFAASAPFDHIGDLT